MTTKKCCLFLLTTAFFAILADEVYAWTYSLKKTGEIKDNLRHCLYSNDQWYTVNSYDLCPLSIEDSAPGFGKGVGFLKGDFIDGMNRVCVYDVLGEKKLIRLNNSVGFCPLQKNF